MKISLEWLSEFVTLPSGTTPATISHDLTMTTVEVEGVHDMAADLEGIVVATIQNIEAHPDHAKARVVDVDAGADALVRVVCGGENLFVGHPVALALPGSHARKRGERVEVTATSIKGVESHGMICSAGELGLGDLFSDEGDRDILDLHEFECSPGDAVSTVLGMDDHVLEIDNKSLTNRPDLFGHHGIARELAAIYDVPLGGLPSFDPPKDVASVGVEIEAPDCCSRYVAARIEGVKVQKSPYAMQARLFRVGQRPINFIVDLSNYAMLAVGQPCHTFAADKIELPIRIRAPKAGEKMRLLDDATIELSEHDLLIADDKVPVALAGVMGGGDSSVSDGTTALILEFAAFEPTGIRRTSTALQARTESSTRFEKGIDPYLIDAGLAYFLEVLHREQPASKVTGFNDVHPTLPSPLAVEVEQSYINRKLGIELSPEASGALLARLGFETQASGSTLSVKIPSWRSTGDVSAPEDIVEEVARLYGYEELPFSPPSILLTHPVSQPRVRLERNLREYLGLVAGMQEIVSYPWVEDRYLEAAANQLPTLSLHAAPSPSTARLQPSLVPHLLKAAVDNLRFYPEFSIFEVAAVFRDADWTSPSRPEERLPGQPKLAAGALIGSDAKQLLLQAKGILSAMSRQIQMAPIELEPGGDAAWAEIGAQLRIMLNSVQIGTVGLASAKARRLADIKKAHVAIFEFELDSLQPHPSRDNDYQPLPCYPHSSFDISMVFPESVTWSSVTAEAEGVHDLVREVSFVDEDIGKQVEAAHKSLTLRLLIGSDDRTLTSDEIQEAGNQVIARLEQKLAGQLRS